MINRYFVCMDKLIDILCNYLLPGIFVVLVVVLMYLLLSLIVEDANRTHWRLNVIDFEIICVIQDKEMIHYLDMENEQYIFECVEKSP
jgi:hypothetical protein